MEIHGHEGLVKEAVSKTGGTAMNLLYLRTAIANVISS
jgi:hypothetical protein